MSGGLRVWDSVVYLLRRARPCYGAPELVNVQGGELNATRISQHDVDHTGDRFSWAT